MVTFKVALYLKIITSMTFHLIIRVQPLKQIEYKIHKVLLPMLPLMEVVYNLSLNIYHNPTLQSLELKIHKILKHTTLTRLYNKNQLACPPTSSKLINQIILAVI